jgi:hypothetical protein
LLRAPSLAIRRFLWNRRAPEEISMSRTHCTAMLMAMTLLAGCKTQRQDPPSAAKPAGTARSPAKATPALPDPPPSASAAALPPPAETQARNMAAMQHLADTLTADATDCEKLAVDLKGFVAENQPLVAMLVAAANWPTDDRATGSDYATAAAVARKLHTAMTTCAATSSVAAAMKGLPGQ